MSDLSLKQIALMKQEFLRSDFGKFAAERITEIHGQLHQQAESATTMEQKASLVDQAAGVTRVIQFFTADVASLEAGLLAEEEPKK